jgi:hypothetical protein
MLDYNLLFMLFSFVGGRDSICSWAALDYVPGGWQRSCMWCVMLTCLFYKFTQAVLEPVGGEKWWTTSLSVEQCREAFYRLGVQDVREFDSDWCSIFCLLREKNKKKKQPGFFFPGRDTLCWLCCVGFSQLLGAIKSCFKGQSLNFMCT